MNKHPENPALPTLLRVARLSFSYPQRHVLTAFSHEFRAGLTWVRGSNGCGKSTLLKLLGGALHPLSGDVAVRGVALMAQPLPYRQEVFWCGPGPLAFDHLSPMEYFGFMRSLYTQLDEEALASHVAGFALQPYQDMPLCTLSTGTQRKVWLAMALSAGTTVTLLDEPINALDAASSAHLRTTLLACAKQDARAWIVASHEPLGAATPLASVLDLPGSPAGEQDSPAMRSIPA